MAQTLIQLQEAAIAAMQEPRSSEKRARKHRAAVLRAYRAKAAKIGYTTEQIEQQVTDIRDMYMLQINAEELSEVLTGGI